MDSREVGLVRSFRGSKSRNKVSVGEPAEGSLPNTRTLPSRKAKQNKYRVVVVVHAYVSIYLHSL